MGVRSMAGTENGIDQEMLLVDEEHYLHNYYDNPHHNEVTHARSSDEQDMLHAESDLADILDVKTPFIPKMSEMVELVGAAVRHFINDEPSATGANIMIMDDQRRGLLSMLVPALFRRNHLEVKMMAGFIMYLS